MLLYRDFVTGKTRRTFARPEQVIKGGPMGFWYLVCRNRASEILIPEHCLIGASITHFNELKRQQQDPEDRIP